MTVAMIVVMVFVAPMTFRYRDLGKIFFIPTNRFLNQCGTKCMFEYFFHDSVLWYVDLKHETCFNPLILLAVVPTMLIIYCVGCIPQAYLFSLGPNAALNAMTFVMINLLFSKYISRIIYDESNLNENSF